MKVQAEHFHDEKGELDAPGDLPFVFGFVDDDDGSGFTIGAENRRGASQTLHLSNHDLFNRVHLLHVHWSVVSGSDRVGFVTPLAPWVSFLSTFLSSSSVIIVYETPG